MVHARATKARRSKRGSTERRKCDRLWSQIGPSSIKKENTSTSSFTGKSREGNLGVSGRWSLRCIYMSFAIYCHVQGKYVKPNKTTKCQQPLETAVNEARKVFHDQFPTSQIPNTKCILKLFTYFLFDFEWYERISDNCQGILRHIGDYVAGDKKLFHYTGETGYIMKVPSKPTRIGLWIYQLVCELENGLPFLIHFE